MLGSVESTSVFSGASNCNECSAGKYTLLPGQTDAISQANISVTVACSLIFVACLMMATVVRIATNQLLLGHARSYLTIVTSQVGLTFCRIFRLFGVFSRKLYRNCRFMYFCFIVQSSLGTDVLTGIDQISMLHRLMCQLLSMRQLLCRDVF